MTEEIPTYDNDTLEERVKTFQRERKGFINDLQKERAERHALETRLAQIETSLTSAGSDGDEQPEKRVERLAADPDGYIENVVQDYVKPLVSEINSLRHERKLERAYQWVAKQEKKEVEDIVGSDLDNDLVRIVKENGMNSMDPIEGTRAAYKILQQERKEKEQQEAERGEKISQSQTERVRVPVRTGGQRFTRDQIRGMSSEEFEANRVAILEAQKNGSIK